MYIQRRVGSGRVGSDFLSAIAGRVGSTFRRVGSGRVQEKWPVDNSGSYNSLQSSIYTTLFKYS